MTIDDVIRWLPSALVAFGGAKAWGALTARFDGLEAGQKLAASQVEKLASEVKAVAVEVGALREAHARSEERHGALSGRVARLEEVDARHDQEIRDARHAAKESAQQVELLAGRVARLESAEAKAGARPRR